MGASTRRRAESCRTPSEAVARSSMGGAAGASDAILGGDCARVVERGCWGGGRCVVGGRHEVVPRTMPRNLLSVPLGLLRAVRVDALFKVREPSRFDPVATPAGHP